MLEFAVTKYVPVPAPANTVLVVFVALTTELLEADDFETTPAIVAEPDTLKLDAPGSEVLPSDIPPEACNVSA